MKVLIVDYEENNEKVKKIVNELIEEDSLHFEYISNNEEDKINKIKEIIKTKVIEKKEVIPSKTMSVEEIKDNDIDELTRMFEEKLSSEEKPTFVKREESVKEKTLDQMTKSLVHYFKPQYSEGIECSYNLYVEGNEKFDLNLEIANNSCQINDKIDKDPNIVINVKDEVWRKILKGDMTAQKAFMTGSLKVKGDFILLSKFDRMFNKQ